MPVVKLKKRSSTVEALQWTGHNEEELKAFVPSQYRQITYGLFGSVIPKIRSPKGLNFAMQGDWIVKHGEYDYCVVGQKDAEKFYIMSEQDAPIAAPEEIKTVILPEEPQMDAPVERVDYYAAMGDHPVVPRRTLGIESLRESFDKTCMQAQYPDAILDRDPGDETECIDEPEPTQYDMRDHGGIGLGFALTGAQPGERPMERLIRRQKELEDELSQVRHEIRLRNQIKASEDRMKAEIASGRTVQGGIDFARPGGDFSAITITSNHPHYAAALALLRDAEERD